MSACLKCGYNAQAHVSASWTLHIDEDPPSLNARLHNAGNKRWAYKAEREHWGWLVKIARVAAGVKNATGKRRVTLTRNYEGRQKERDADNLAGGMKVVVDSLVREGLLVDDSPTHAEIHYSQRRTSPRGLVVLIEELI